MHGGFLRGAQLGMGAGEGVSWCCSPPAPWQGQWERGSRDFHSRENPETPELRAGAGFGQDLLLPATGVRGCSSQLGNALCACGWERTAGK